MIEDILLDILFSYFLRGLWESKATVPRKFWNEIFAGKKAPAERF
jgi:hypothetical protein